VKEGEKVRARARVCVCVREREREREESNTAQCSALNHKTMAVRKATAPAQCHSLLLWS